MTEQSLEAPVRARDPGLDIAGTPGACNAITDVPGVLVGYSTLIERDGPLFVDAGPVRTGATAILRRGHERLLEVMRRHGRCA